MVRRVFGLEHTMKNFHDDMRYNKKSNKNSSGHHITQIYMPNLQLKIYEWSIVTSNGSAVQGIIPEFFSR